ncbi:MAG TPA: hypothetical protein VF624_13820 [Tepidisphaeraceae bacterium]
MAELSHLAEQLDVCVSVLESDMLAKLREAKQAAQLAGLLHRWLVTGTSIGGANTLSERRKLFLDKAVEAHHKFSEVVAHMTKSDNAFDNEVTVLDMIVGGLTRQRDDNPDKTPF